MCRVFLLIALCVGGFVPELLGQSTGDPSTARSRGGGDKIDLTTTHHVTLHLKSAMPDAAVAAMSAKCGVVMQFAGPYAGELPDVAHDFDADDEPLAMSLLHLCSVYGLDVVNYEGEDRALMFMRPSTQKRDEPPPSFWQAKTSQSLPPASLNGPFAVIAREIIHDRWIDPLPVDNAAGGAGGAAVQPGQDHFELQLTVLAEPGVTVLSVPTMPRIAAMVDDQNQPLWNAPQEGAMSDRPPRDTLPVSFHLPLRTPSPAATEIASLRGSVAVHVVTSSHRYEWDNLDRSGLRTEVVNGMRVTFQPLQDDLGTPTQLAIIDIDRNGMDQQDWIQGQALVGDGSHIQIFDRADNLLSDTYSWYPTTDSMQLHIALPWGKTAAHGGKGGPPFKLVWDWPKEAGDVEVPFSFTHLPLPRQ